jgi:hypothetical protein
VFFAESHGPRALGKGNLHRGPALRRELSLKALSEGYLHCVPYLRRERFLVLSAKSCAESSYFGSWQRFWLTVKGLFPVMKPQCRSGPQSSRNLSPPPSPHHLTASWHGEASAASVGKEVAARPPPRLTRAGIAATQLPTGRGRAAVAAVSDVKEEAAQTLSPHLATAQLPTGG